MKGIIFLDLDGTLLNKQSKISQSNHNILKELGKKGYLSVIASGRSPKEIVSLTSGTNINSYISLNGQYVVYEGRVIGDYQIPFSIATRLLEEAEKLGHPVASYTPSEYRINFLDDTTKKLYLLDNAPLPVIDKQFPFKNQINLLYLFSENLKHDCILQKIFEKELTFFRDSKYSVTIVTKGRSKQSGILDIYSILKSIPLEKTYAFGDGNNDISMFNAVGHAIAMGNGTPAVKSAAEFVTKNHDQDGIEDGIEAALKHYRII